MRCSKAAGDTLAVFAGRLHDEPMAMPQMLVGLDFQLPKPQQIVIAGSPEAPDTQATIAAVHQWFLPNKILLLAEGGEGQKTLGTYLEFLRDIQPLEHRATAYVCENYDCQLPTTNANTLRAQLGRTSRKAQN